MPEWGAMIDPDQLIKEMLDLKVKLEDFSKRMERVESALFIEASARCIDCGYYRCDDHSVVLR